MYVVMGKKFMVDAYSFELSDKFLTQEEQLVFDDYLHSQELDRAVWEVFASLFRSGVNNTQPIMLRVYSDAELCGAIVLTRCSGYGKALFDSKLLAGIINLLSIPYYQWIKFGCCMDMMSNPGFVRYPEKADEVIRLAIRFLKKHSILTIINDYTENSSLYDGASILPALPHALIDCSGMISIQDYMQAYKNIKRKLKTFKNKGGNYIRVEHKLDDEQLDFLKKCFKSTAEKSVFYLPYQDLYLNAALTTSSTKIQNVHYFIATLDGEFLGYQAAVKTGKFLNALHGAFDRDRKTTYHAYDILYVKMTEFALEHGLKICDFGAVVNFTKQKMVNKTIDMSYFLLGKYALVQHIFSWFLKLTKIQGEKQLQFKTES
jgi:hypothetical protein